MRRVFFDTSFLLRFYLNDVPKQAAKAKRMVAAAKEGALLLVTDFIVICEIVSVLDSYYGLPRKKISEKMMHLYQTPGVTVINGEILPEALTVYVEKNIDFSDAVIGVTAARNHFEYLASFDKKHMDRFADLGLRRIESLEDLADG